MNAKELATKIVVFLQENMKRESSLLYPEPNIVLYDVEGLLHVITSENVLSEAEINSIFKGE